MNGTIVPLRHLAQGVEIAAVAGVTGKKGSRNLFSERARTCMAR